MDTLGVGLIGCGGMGLSLGRGLQELESARLVGVTDVSEAATTRAGAEFGVPGFPTAAALLKQPGLNAVLIAAPGFEHRPLAELAAAAGKHLFIEKPLATNTADCDALIAAAQRAGVTLMVGQVLRYYPTWWKILELVHAGAIGRPLGVTVTRIGGPYTGDLARDWRNSLALSGGILMEVNAHEIDFMCQVCGDVKRVYAEADHYLDDPADFPNLCFVSLRFTSGAVGLLHSSNIAHLPDLSGTIQGAEGTLSYGNGFGQGGEIRLARRDGGGETIPIGSIEKEPPVRHELRLFVEAVLNGSAPAIPGSEGRRNVAIAEAAYESARTGQPVAL